MKFIFHGFFILLGTAKNDYPSNQEESSVLFKSIGKLLHIHIGRVVKNIDFMVKYNCCY